MSNVTIFAPESTSLTFTTKKGDLKSISAEGACWKGGLALAALKDKAMESAIAKCVNGRYGAATDIAGAAFPSVLKAGEQFLIGGPAANKVNFTAFCDAVMNFTPKAGKEFTVKQQAVRTMTRICLAVVRPVETDDLEMVERVNTDAE
jgi:hypothetical protein